MLIICIDISFICSSGNVIIDSCLLFVDDHSVMASLLLLMSLIWNVVYYVLCSRVERF